MYKKFPENSKIGIKHPYMVLTYQGTFELRNDNPSNILYVEPGFEDLEEQAVRCLKQKEYFQAVKAYTSLLKLVENDQEYQEAQDW